MILERVVIHVLPGQEESFEAALLEARKVIGRADGFRSLEALRGIESPHDYLLLIEWERLEDHVPGFRESELFNDWRALIGPHFDGAPELEHYAPLAGV
jgi:heme-degrading monooxygenase HmoA